jgi:hypothetical protein
MGFRIGTSANDARDELSLHLLAFGMAISEEKS